MKYRILPLETYNAFMNMAIDEMLCEVASKNQQPVIRFYRWNPSAVSIGYFQSLQDEVNTDACNKKGIDIVRRRTGGGAVFHSYTGEITYSVIGPVSLYPKNIIDSYKEVCQWIINALKHLGIDASFIPINDLIANGKKISGNAQTRRNNIFLQHGTILYDVDVDLMFSLLKVPNEKIRDKIISSVKERVTSVKQLSDTSLDDTYQALLKGFTENKEYEMSVLTNDEIKRAQEIAESRYKTTEWAHLK